MEPTCIFYNFCSLCIMNSAVSTHELVRIRLSTALIYCDSKTCSLMLKTHKFKMFLLHDNLFMVSDCLCSILIIRHSITKAQLFFRTPVQCFMAFDMTDELNQITYRTIAQQSQPNSPASQTKTILGTYRINLTN